MTYNALDIAKYIINLCMVENQAVSNLQLQFILYCLQREFLQIHRVLFDDEIEAWQFGPAVPKVYYMYCGFGSLPIRVHYDISLNEDYIPIIDCTVRSKRILKPWHLANHVQDPNRAWAKVFRNGLGDHQIIPKELIRTLG